MMKSQIQHSNIPTQSADRTSLTSVSEDDKIKQINRDKDPEDDLDKALDDDAANEEEDDELEEEDEVQKAAKANRDYGVFTLANRFDDEGEVEEAKEDHIELLEAREDSAEAFEAAEQSLDLVALLVKGSVVVPGLDTIGLGRNHRKHAQVEHQLSCLIAFVSAIHQHGKAFGHSRKLHSSSRPAGASWALPGDREKAMAVRASAATI